MTSPKAGDILVHPEDDPRDPNATRLIARGNLPRSDWPWIRITGDDVAKVPSWGSDVSGWTPQAAETFGHIMGQAKQPLVPPGGVYDIP